MVISCGMAEALTIPRGTLYFDNSLTQYANVQFVFGSDEAQVTYVKNMVFDGRKWAVTIDAPVPNMYRYTFSNTTIPEGQINRSFSSVKDSISNRIGAYRTGTTSADFNAGQIYVPTSGDNWATGNWMALSFWENSEHATAAVSGTLPVMYVNTIGHQAINSKEEYISATCYIDSVLPQFRAYASAVAPASVQIRGRGNWTWSSFDKKPYKLKLESGSKLLGMHKSKHWALMAGADDNLGFLRNPVGYMISDLLGMRWTPSCQPVELVLNGQYQGLYFLTETVRIDNKRIDITEQRDGCTDTDSITGGWLVEIDNYSSDGQVTFREGNGQWLMVTIKEPEVLSQPQRNYIQQQMLALNSAFYETTSAHWESMVDLDELAKYYLVQEIMEDCESFHGSCFIYKDMGADAKWFFGPVWDFGNAFNRHQGRFVYDHPSFDQYWIGQIATFPAFQTRVRELWHTFLHEDYELLCDSIRWFADEISAAAANDAVCWRDSRSVCKNGDMSARLAQFMDCLEWRVSWLRSQWGEGATSMPNADALQPASQKTVENGRIVIIRDGVRYSVLGYRL